MVWMAVALGQLAAIGSSEQTAVGHMCMHRVSPIKVRASPRPPAQRFIILIGRIAIKEIIHSALCGGSGAGPDFDGTDAVHTHMTNSRLTDPEVLEWRYPVLLESFEIRHGSGGVGTHNGGNGVRRRLRFLEDMEAVILANHRIIPPYGMNGGGTGAVGRNWVERTDGTIDEFGATGLRKMAPGDVFVIETPGGGGFGKANQKAAE